MSAWGAWWVLKTLYLPGGAFFVFCQKRLYNKMKCGFEGYVFKCQSWPLLGKQHFVRLFGSIKPLECRN